MSRLSFRPRPLDIHKKLPIVKSVKEFDDDDELYTPFTSTRNSRLAAEADTEVHHIPRKKPSQEIPTPQFLVVESYEKDYSCTFTQTTSYLRGRGARAEIGEFVEYDLDNEDEDWLEEFNRERQILPPEKFETLLFKLEVLDHKTRERAGVITSTFVSPIPVLLQPDAAAEALKFQSVQFAVLQSVYNYWKAKREQWQKPILRHLQPPPPANDTNPYNVFRPREKAHRLHTRRMQRRDNSVQSFERLRLVRQNLDQARTVFKALIKREEKKRELMESEINLQKIQMEYKLEEQLIEDGMLLPDFPQDGSRFRLSEDDYADSDDTTNSQPNARLAEVRNRHLMESRLIMVQETERLKQEPRKGPLRNGWLHKQEPLDPHEPVLLFTRPLHPERMAAAGIPWPADPHVGNSSTRSPYRYRGRIGRGGRIVFDRCSLLRRDSIDHQSSSPVPLNPRPPLPNG